MTEQDLTGQYVRIFFTNGESIRGTIDQVSRTLLTVTDGEGSLIVYKHAIAFIAIETH